MEFCLRLLCPENALAMRICCETGLRIDDVLSLRPKILERDRFSVMEKKTGKRRIIRLSAETRRLCLRETGDYYIFPGRDDARKHRTRQAVWKDLKRAAVSLRLPGNVTPHSARKMYADYLYRSTNGNIEAVKKALNHSSSEVTYFYYLCDFAKLNRKSYKSVKPMKSI